MTTRRAHSPSDLAVLVGIGCLAALSALLWLWGGLAGALFGSGWPHLDLAQLGGVLIHLPVHLSDPANAWPPVARSQLPGPAGFYAALLITLGALALVLEAASRAAVALTLIRRGLTRWGADEVVALTRGRRRAGRLALGRRGRRTFRAEQRHAVVAFGPPQSGKSAGLAIPALLEWEGPAVASSVKTDLLSATARRRRALGRVMVFDPLGLSGARSNTWTPLHGARTWEGALQIASRLASAGTIDTSGLGDAEHRALATEQRLAALLYTATRTDAPIETVVRWADGQGTRELHDALALSAEAAGDEHELADAGAAYDVVRAFEGQGDWRRSSIQATAQALLRAYRFRRVAQSAGSCEITADTVLDEGATLYLIGDPRASELLRPLFTALLLEVVDRAYERATMNGGMLQPPLLLCLDELGGVAALPKLAEIASTAPSHNIQLVSIFNDLRQAQTRYGQHAETVVNSHRARMLLPGVADLQTLRYFAGQLAEERTLELRPSGRVVHGTHSANWRERPVVAPQGLRQLPERHALLLYGRLPPTRLRLRTWFEDRRLRRLAKAR